MSMCIHTHTFAMGMSGIWKQLLKAVKTNNQHWSND